MKKLGRKKASLRHKHKIRGTRFRFGTRHLDCFACFIFSNFRARGGIGFCMAQTPSLGDKESVSVSLKVLRLIRDAGVTQSWSPATNPMGFFWNHIVSQRPYQRELTLRFSWLAPGRPRWWLKDWNMPILVRGWLLRWPSRAPPLPHIQALLQGTAWLGKSLHHHPSSALRLAPADTDQGATLPSPHPTPSNLSGVAGVGHTAHSPVQQGDQSPDMDICSGEGPISNVTKPSWGRASSTTTVTQGRPRAVCGEVRDNLEAKNNQLKVCKWTREEKKLRFSNLEKESKSTGDSIALSEHGTLKGRTVWVFHFL